VFCDDGRGREMGDKAGNNVENTSGYAKSGVWLAPLGLEYLGSVFLPTGLGAVPVVSGMPN